MHLNLYGSPVADDSTLCTQSGNGYSTRVHQPGHLACNPLSRRKASHVSPQGKEAVFVTHDI